MELRHLRYFVAVAEAENFHRAATSLNVSQPTVSRQIMDLEAELGCALLSREERGVKLTPAGVFLLERARFVLAEINSSVRIIKLYAKGEAGNLRVGFIDVGLRNPLVVTVLDQFRRLMPSVTIELVPLDQLEEGPTLWDAGLDAVIAFNAEPLARDKCAVSLSIERWALALPSGHRLTDRPIAKLRDLAGDKFVTIGAAKWPKIYDLVRLRCLERGLVPTIVQEAHSEESLLSLIAAGVGIGFVNSSSRRLPGIIYKDVHDLNLSISLDLIWPAASNRPILLQFAELVRSLANVQRPDFPAQFIARNA